MNRKILDARCKFAKAVRCGDLTSVRELASECCLKGWWMWRDECILLAEALKYKHIDVAKLLLELGAKVNMDRSVRYECELPIFRANELPVFNAIQIGDMEFLGQLLRKGARFEPRHDFAGPALLDAVQKGNFTLIDLILQYSIDRVLTFQIHKAVIKEALLNFCSSKIISDFADRPSDIDILLLLCDCGYANLVHEILKKRSLSGLFVKNLSLNTETLSGASYVVESLLDKCPDLSADSSEGYQSLMMSAITFHKLWLVKTLLRRKVNLNVSNKELSSYLGCAVLEKQMDIVVALLEHGADVDAVAGKSGNKAIHLATNVLCVDIVKTLLVYHADVNTRNRCFRTALDIATKEVDNDIIGILLEKGAKVHPLIAPRLFSNSTYQRHRIKFKALNLKVTENRLTLQYLQDLEKNLPQNFQQDVLKEVNLMKTEKIADTRISFYDVATSNLPKLANYAKNLDVIEALKAEEDYRVRFPNFAGMIHMNMRKGQIRRLLLDKCTAFITSYLPQVPDIYVELILSYLTDKELRFLRNHLDRN